MPDRDVRRILVVDLLGGLGDLVMALPVVHALHRRHPTRSCACSPSPGDGSLRHDPAVTAVCAPSAGGSGPPCSPSWTAGARTSP